MDARPDLSRASKYNSQQLRRILSEPDLFRMIFDAFPLQVVVKDARPATCGQFMHWNCVAEEWMGLQAGQDRPPTDYDIFPADQAAFFAAKDAEVTRSRQVLDIPEEPFQHRSLGLRYLHTIKTPVFDESGEPIALLIVSEDITDRKLAVAELDATLRHLREERNLFHALLDHLPVCVFAKSARAENFGEYVHWNRVMEELHGLRADEVLGLHASDIFGLEEARSLEQQDRQVVAEGAALDIPLQPITYQRSGRRLMHSVKVPVYDADGLPLAIVGVAEDITERVRAESALRESEERWNLALASTEAGVWDWNVRSGAVFCSERWQRMFGFTDAALPRTPRGLLNLVHKEDRAMVRASAFALLRRDTELFRCEYRMRRPGGSTVWILAHAKAHFDPDGCATRMIGTLIDVTARKNVEAQLVEAKVAAENASRAKGDFLAMMSHEIRTPLNGVLGFAELLAGTPLDAIQGEYLNTIRESGSNLLRVLNDVLDYSKMESGRLGLDRQPCVLREVVVGAAETFRAGAAAKHLDLVCEVAPDVPAFVVVDALRLRQVLTNLISNAIKFTTTGGVTLRIERVAAGEEGFANLRLSVTDSGIGIAEKDLPRLFQPFEQLDFSMARRFGGTGLGLTIVHRLVQMMDGSITATSEPGRGTTFTIDLTLRVPDMAPEIPPVGEVPVAAVAPARLAILLVDDHAVNRRLARLMLQRLGYEPTEAASGEEAVELAAQRNYDVIFMDVQMPGMDGYEAARRIRETSPRVQIVALTAHALPVDRQRSVESGMQAYLTKPVRGDDLCAVLEECVARALQNDAID